MTSRGPPYTSSMVIFTHLYQLRSSVVVTEYQCLTIPIPWMFHISWSSMCTRIPVSLWIRSLRSEVQGGLGLRHYYLYLVADWLIHHGFSKMASPRNLSEPTNFPRYGGGGPPLQCTRYFNFPRFFFFYIYILLSPHKERHNIPVLFLFHKLLFPKFQVYLYVFL